MTDLLSQLEAKIATAEKDFHDRGERIGVLQGQRAEIDREIAKLQAEQLELRGAYQGLKQLRAEIALTEEDKAN